MDRETGRRVRHARRALPNNGSGEPPMAGGSPYRQGSPLAPLLLRRDGSQGNKALVVEKERNDGNIESSRP